ncbi:MAG: twin-arginine translocase TatA/TatE family subunit [Alphaproteobacteria bacterium]|nr:twin-arginine translocase TatA/TatE family subunit [Alphaproteobacteria bacterium]
MFDLGTWGEILIILVAALLLIGPKELPDLLRGLGRMIQKFKRLSSGLRREIDQYIHEGEFEEYTKGANVLGMMGQDESRAGDENLEEKEARGKTLSKKKKKPSSKKGSEK